MGTQSVNYLFDNQVTHEEFEKITDMLVVMLEGVIWKNLRMRAQEMLYKSLTLDLKDDQRMTINYDITLCKGDIDSFLGTMRKGKKHGKRKN